MTDFAGGQVLLGRDPGYNVIDWLPIYKFAMGVLAVLVTALSGQARAVYCWPWPWRACATARLASSRASDGTLLAEHAPALCFALKETTHSLLWVLVTPQ